MSHLKNVISLCLWSHLNPLKVNNTVQNTETVWPARLAWSLNGFLVGLLLSFVVLGFDAGPRLLILPALGVVFALLASVYATEKSADSLGLMLLSLAVPAMLVPRFSAQRPAEGQQSFFGDGLKSFLVTVGLLLLMILAFKVLSYIIKQLIEVGMNRAFVMWPMLLIFASALSAAGGGTWAFRLAWGGATPPAAAGAATLLLGLLVFQTQSAQTVVQSFKYHYNTESYYAHPLASFKRRLALTYLLYGGLIFAASFFFPHLPTIRPTAYAFFAASVLTLDLPQYLFLSLWMAAKNRRLRSRHPARSARADGGVLFTMPALPFEPLGLEGYLLATRARRGSRTSASLAQRLILETSYSSAPSEFIEGLALEDTALYLRVMRELADAEPRMEAEPAEAAPAGGTTPAASRSWSRVPVLTAPDLLRDKAGALGLDEQQFIHYYEAPRGREGASLAMWPIWFPVATAPVETMTLKQVIYRSLTSVREPFRRTRILVDDGQAAKQIYGRIIRWSTLWARSNPGASLFPIPLSLKRLAEAAPELTSLSKQIVRQRTASNLQGTRAGAPPVADECRRVLELGSSKVAISFDDMAEAVMSGNAWIILKDDSDAGDDLKTVKRALDLVFGESGCSHAAIILVTARKECLPLSDMQTFQGFERRARKVPARLRMPGRLAARLCRVTAAWGSPSTRASLVAAGLVAAGLLVYLVVNYDVLLNLSPPPPAMPFAEKVRRAGPALIYILPVALLVLPLFVGYKWGLGAGSEEVRQSAVDVMFTTLPALLLLLLALLPSRMSPGPLRTACIVLAGAPGTFVLSVTIIALVCMVSDAAWLVISTRVLRAVDERSLGELCQRYNVTLHVACQAAAVPLPQTSSDRERLPLLLSFKTAGVLPLFVATFPRLVSEFRKLIFLGLKKEGLQSNLNYSCSSVLLNGLASDEGAACRRCLELVADDCVCSWGDKDSFSDYRQPSSSFTMNALEYAARQLCYLTNLEELIVVR